MPIKVTCQCGKSFAAKDELAGKAVKCPNCQQPLRIPGAGAPAAAPARNLAAPLPSAAPHQPATPASTFGPPAGGGGTHSLFDEVGLKQAPVGAQMCPGCAGALAPGAVVCIKCGYNLKLGRRMETVRMGGEASGAAGHTVATSDLMTKAAISIEEDKEEDRKKTKEGMPWWVYLIGLFFAMGFIIMMMVLPQRVALMTGGILLYTLAFFVHLYAIIRIWMVAFIEDGVGTGIAVVIGTFICGLGLLIYIFMRWDRCGAYFLIMLATDVVTSLIEGAIIANMGGEEEARASRPPAAAVAAAGFDWQPPQLLKADIA
jgi:hypothetical protein